MTATDYALIARVLKQSRHWEASAPISSVVAMITCDLADAFRQADPDFDFARFHTEVNA